MNQKDREFLSAKLDPMHEDVRELKKSVAGLHERIGQVEIQAASIRWHDWAIRGSIAGIGAIVVTIAGYLMTH